MPNPTPLSADRQPTRQGVLDAAAKVAAILPPTPLLPLEVEGVTVWCKAECLQPIGAFKIRGAWHRLTDLSPAERAQGVVAFSSGNHAQGVAWAAKRLGVPATIVMPLDAPAKKVDNTRALGAEVVLYDRYSESREEIAARLADERGATVVPSFDNAWVIEGQGSLAVEAAAQLQALAGRTPAEWVACCGGGGLASGIALASGGVPLTIVEPEGWDDAGRSLLAGYPVPVAANPPPTLCDAIQTPMIADRTLAVLSAAGARAVTVSESDVETAMRCAFDRLRLVVEPGGAVALAAVLVAEVEPREGLCLTLSGGNVDADVYARVLTKS